MTCEMYDLKKNTNNRNEKGKWEMKEEDLNKNIKNKTLHGKVYIVTFCN